MPQTPAPVIKTDSGGRFRLLVHGRHLIWTLRAGPNYFRDRENVLIIDPEEEWSCYHLSRTNAQQQYDVLRECLFHHVTLRPRNTINLSSSACFMRRVGDAVNACCYRV